MGKEPKKVKFYFTLLSLFSILMLFLTIFGDQGIIELKKLTNKHNGTIENIAKLKKENASLLIEIDKLKTSRHYIEKLARKEFGMVKEGEVIFLFQD